MNDRKDHLEVIPGMVPPATDFPSGCRFRNRCEKAADACGERLSEPQSVGVHGGRAACVHLDGVG